MRKLIAILSVSLLLQVASAKEAAKEHRHHHSHQHGSAELAIAFDKNQGKVEFKTPSDSIVGFEHMAKSAKDKKTLADATAAIEKNISKIIQFDGKLNCQFKKESIDMIQEKEELHSDFVANFIVTCGASPLATSLVIDFSSYAKLKDIDVSLLIDSLQKSVEIKSEKKVIELK